MKVEGTGLFTIERINRGKPEMSKHMHKLTHFIARLMRKYGIKRIEV